MKLVRLIISGFRFTFRIVLVLLILAPTPGWGLEDKIVFVSNRNGTPEVYLVEGLNGRPLQLTRNMFASWPSISPNGAEVVFASRPPDGISNIFKLHLATNRIEKMTNTRIFDAEYRYLDWAPDGRTILFTKIVREKTDLYVMDMKSRNLRRILMPQIQTYIRHPSWSPDSQHILYAVTHVLPGMFVLPFGVDKLRKRELFITDDNGNRVEKVEQDLTPLESANALLVPTWSPRRGEIAYLGLAKLPPNPWQIYTMNLEDGMVTAVTAGGAEEKSPMGWSPDGRRILVNISSSVEEEPIDEEDRWADTYVMSPDGDNMMNLTRSPEREGSACWSPDGKQIAFSRRLNEGGSAIFVMDADGQNQRRLSFEPGTNIVSHWSPDGDRIAFLSIRDGGRRIYTMDTDGQNVRQITHRRRAFESAPAWSPDGKWLAFGSGDKGGWGIYLVDPQGGNETQIFHSNASNLDYSVLGRPAWSPDSQHLIFVAPWAEAWREGYAGLVRIRVDGGIPTYLKTEELSHWESPVWSPDGNTLLFSARKQQKPEDAIFFINLITSESRHFILPGIHELLMTSDWAFHRLVWSPDGSQLLLSIGPLRREIHWESRLYLIDIASETVRLWMDDASEADWVRPASCMLSIPVKTHCYMGSIKTSRRNDAQVIP